MVVNHYVQSMRDGEGQRKTCDTKEIEPTDIHNIEICGLHKQNSQLLLHQIHNLAKQMFVVFSENNLTERVAGAVSITGE